MALADIPAFEAWAAGIFFDLAALAEEAECRIPVLGDNIPVLSGEAPAFAVLPSPGTAGKSRLIGVYNGYTWFHLPVRS